MDEERFLGGWTRSKLAARTPEERYDIWKRAKGLHTADGNQLAREIERIGLPKEVPALPEADILTHVIADIVRSNAGRSALKEATLDGLPAIAGADSLLHEALGAKYRRNEKAVATAQRITAEVMAEMGYEPVGAKPLPARYVAREGVFWRKG
ncbi:MAG: hypothetical protein JWO33_136 [Caulobacteraceae bacterium]|nr:hypothetical protein [Caulobacteraceae bacterium]